MGDVSLELDRRVGDDLVVGKLSCTSGSYNDFSDADFDVGLAALVLRGVATLDGGSDINRRIDEILVVVQV